MTASPHREETLMKLSAVSIALVLFVSTGCAGRTPPPTRYVKAQVVAETVKTPPVVTVPKPMPLPGQLRPLPARQGGLHHAAGKQPAGVVQEANAKPTSSPDPGRDSNSVMAFDYR